MDGEVLTTPFTILPFKQQDKLAVIQQQGNPPPHLSPPHPAPDCSLQ